MVTLINRHLDSEIDKNMQQINFSTTELFVYIALISLFKIKQHMGMSTSIGSKNLVNEKFMLLPKQFHTT